MSSVLHLADDPSGAELEVREGLEAGGFHVVLLDPAASGMRDALPRVDAVLISAGLEASVAVARQVHQSSPGTPIVFLTDEESETRLERSLFPAPRLGKEWSITRSEPASAAVEAVRRAIDAAAKRRRLRTTLSSINATMGDVPFRQRRTIVTDHYIAAILDQLSDAVLILGLDGEVATSNEAAQDCFGDSIDTDALADFFGRGRTPAEREEPSLEQISIPRPGKPPATLELRITPVRDDAGEKIATAIVGRDISSRVEEERRRELVNTAVRTLAASGLDIERGLAETAELFTRWFAAACTIDLLEGETVRRCASSPGGAEGGPEPILLSEWKGPVAAAIASGSTRIGQSVPVPQIARSPVEAARFEQLELARWIAAPLRSANVSIGALSVGRTSSVQRFSREEIEVVEQCATHIATAVENVRAYHAAAEANRAKDEFLATLSHELRTPMTSIVGWIRMLRSGLDEQTSSEAMEAIEQSARIQAQLIDDMLDLSRIEMGKLHLKLSDVDLGGVVRAAIDTVRPSAAAKRLDLVTSIAVDRYLVAGDPNRLQQVVWNLLSNSVKFTPSGGRIEVAVDRVESKARLQVSDSGKGIESVFLPFVFDRFRQAEGSTTRRHGGLGLGLAIVKQIVELHGGTVTAASRGTDLGATFTVELPLLAVTPQGDDDAERFDPGTSLVGVEVVVVEDDASSARMIAAALERRGAAVRVARSADDALVALRERIPHVVVSDVAMPDRDGLDLIREIRTTLRISAERLPALALTAYGDLETRVRILGAGFQQHVQKPVDPAELVLSVARLAGR
jgi:signal transduction histidine kinase/DNA-binding response OmpR family regulator